MPKTRAASISRTEARSRLTKTLAGRHIRVGISGWRYPGWRGKFYPKELPHHRELEFASGALNSVEINGSFYSLQLPSSYKRWYDATPEQFLFAVKGGRFITHMKKLRGVDTALANFFASGVLALREKLGPILWQLPPNLGFDAKRLAEFFELLPRSAAEAAALARGHNDKLKTRAFLKIDPEALGPVRHAIEVRHPSFLVPEFFELLRRHNIAFVFADTAGKWPYAENLTADFVYIRLHGAEQLYVSGYSDRALDWWAARIDKWRVGKQPRDARLVGTPRCKVRGHRSGMSLPKDVFVYFDNDAKVHAPFDAIRLAKRLRINWSPRKT